MGNCVGSSKESPKVEKRSRNVENGSNNNITSASPVVEEETKSVIRILATIQRRSPSGEWGDALEDGTVPLDVHREERKKKLVYTLKAADTCPRPFHVEIEMPGSEVLVCGGENAVQWTGEDGDAWRMVFSSEDTVKDFLKSCPMSLAKEVAPSAAPQNEEQIEIVEINDLPIPEVDAPADQVCRVGEETAADLSCKMSTSTSFNASIKSNDDDDFGADSDSMELFDPSSPFQVKQEQFLLPDIMEEADELESQDAGAELTIDSDFGADDRLNQTSSTLEETETSFSEQVLGILERTGSLRVQSQDRSSPPPVLPVSPPPGPLLLSDLKKPIPPVPRVTTAMSETNKPPPHFKSEVSFRHSIVGALDDIPPPLPKTQPPGKLMSPRHSLFLDLADVGNMASGYCATELDLSQLVPQMTRIREAPVEKKTTSKEDKDVTKMKQGNFETGSLPSLVPPPLLEESLNKSKKDPEKSKRPESYYYKTFEPPKEFSDSGYQDTDNATDGRRTQSPPPTTTADSTQVPPAIHIEYMQATQTWVQHIDSSTTFTSDDQMTENSGSVGLKPEDSPKSESKNEQDQEQDHCKEGKLHNSNPPPLYHQSCAEDSQVSETTRAIPPIRKTGWLEMKAQLVSKNKKVDMRAKRRWKKYWAYLKDSVMFFYECEEENALPELESVHADMKLDLELSLAHAVHDHVKRDNLFCLSTSHGNTYYMQCTSPFEVEDWIASIHCAAAVSLTKTDKEHSVAVLTKKMEELKENIEKENKLKNMLSLVPTDTTAAPDKLSLEFSENLEKFQVELYRIRCYIASLQDLELPNPHSLLASISKPTKILLGNIGIISVASVHAIVSARNSSSSASVSGQTSKSSKQKSKSSTMPRSPSIQLFRKGLVEISGPYPNNSSAGQGATWNPSAKAKSSSLPTNMKGSVSLRSFKISGPHLHLPKTELSRTPEGTPRKKRSLDISGPYPKLSSSALRTSPFIPSDQEDKTDDEVAAAVSSSSLSMWPAELNIVTIRIPPVKAHGEDQSIQWTLRNDTTATQLLSSLCEKYELHYPDYFLKLRTAVEGTFQCHILNSQDIVSSQVFDELELCPKTLKSVQLDTKESKDFGLALAAVWNKKTEIDLESVLIEEVVKGSVAEAAGISVGDEIALVNGTSVIELGWTEVERLMTESEEVELMLRQSLAEAAPSSPSAVIVDSLICPPPPPRQPELSAEVLTSLIIPTPSIDSDSSVLLDEPSRLSGLSQDQIDHLINHSNEIQRLLRRWKAQQSDDSSSSPWTMEDKLRKSIQDLVETEGEYIRLLNVLVERYLEPLKQETLLKAQEVENLTGGVFDITKVQNNFFTSLKGILIEETQLSTSEFLKQVVEKVTKLFQEHIGHFKKYSSFCASHQIIKDLLASESELVLEYFRTRNPTTDPGLNVDRLLAKPIVRILRYPLFLKAMQDHMDKNSHESRLLKEIIDEMGRVADYINEMQRLCETYWSTIHQLSSSKGLMEIGVSVRITELEYHGEMTWLNPGLSKGWKKGQGPTAHMFIFRPAIVIICSLGKQRRKDSKTAAETKHESESTKFRELLPTVKCRVSNLPDSDGVTNMWHLQCRTQFDNQMTTYLFRTSSTQEKQLAIQAAQRSIREQHKLYGSSPRHTPSSSPLPPNLGVNERPSPSVNSHSPARLQPIRKNTPTLHPSNRTPSASDTD